MTARVVIVILAVLATHLVAAYVGRVIGEADGWHAAEVHAQRCSELALGYGYSYGLELARPQADRPSPPRKLPRERLGR